MKIFKQARRSKRGAALVEYGLIVAGVALVAAAAVSVFGSKTSGMIAASARILPGENATDNHAIEVGHIIQTKTDGNTIQVDTSATALDSQLHTNLGLDDNDLITDPNQ